MAANRENPVQIRKVAALSQSTAKRQSTLPLMIRRSGCVGSGLVLKHSDI